ncbi:MAG: hypothetical protein L6Q54_12785 [Leptospiraceae bacterium]|nr:hypothetical protein [Leptospiraceae bacterium]MCK6382110.1 hypothetical protein [Leptospiraceae bacterium]NUM42104.1 hypothetical protein [Leptospiraceae bacterium]
MKQSSLIKIFVLSALIFVFSIVGQDAPGNTNADNPEANTSPQTKPEDKPKNDPASDQPATASAIFVNSKTSFELKATDDNTQVEYIEYRINGGEFQKYSTPISLSEEGQTTINYRAVDKAENKEPLKALIVIVDNTNPSVAIAPSEPPFILEGKNFASPKTTYTFKADDKVSGVKKIEYQIDNETKQEYTNQAIKIEKSGMHVVKFSATDNAGNTSNESTYIINVDDTKPTVELKESIPFLTVDGKNYSKKGTTISAKATDNESGVFKVLIKIDSASDFTPYTEPVSITTQGEHSIEAKAIDNVGNESEVKKITFFSDVTPPSTTIKTIAPSSTPPAQ